MYFNYVAIIVACFCTFWDYSAAVCRSCNDNDFLLFLKYLMNTMHCAMRLRWQTISCNFFSN